MTDRDDVERRAFKTWYDRSDNTWGGSDIAIWQAACAWAYAYQREQDAQLSKEVVKKYPPYSTCAYCASNAIAAYEAAIRGKG